VQGGHPAPPGEFTHWLVKDAQANKVHVVPPESSGAKRSVLVIEDAIPVEAHNLLRLCPLTGRPHQIRCQLSHLGVPIVGDIKYGAPGGASGKIALHAYSIQFRHPTRGEQIEITCPLPADWASYVTLRQPKLKQFTEPRSARITPAP
jgi:23S rRNA pseudouridine1911/1915/1917 synthase